MLRGKSPTRILALVVVFAALLAVSLACATAEPTATPAAPAQPDAPVAPTLAPQMTATLVPGVPTPIPARATPTRVLPTATAVMGMAGPEYGGILRNAKPLGPIDSLDGHLNRRYEALEAMFAMYNNIVQIAPDGTIAADLASRWDISDDGRSINFTLQSGVKFHDGTTMDAQAVKWNLDRILDPDTDSAQRFVIGPYVSSVEVVDTSTVRVNLSEPFRPFLAILGERSGYVLSPTAVQSMGDEFHRRPVGTGPFKIQDWVPSGNITLERFDDYWEEDKPYLDGIRFQEVSDNDIRLAMIRTDETDVITEVEPSQIPLVENDPKIQVAAFSGGQTWGFRWVITPPFDSVALRQAIGYATDREAFSDVFYQGRARVAYVPANMSWEYNPTLQPLKFDLSKAQEKLVEAGYPNGVDLSLWCRGTNIEIQRCEFYQAMLKDANIKVDLRTVSASDYWISFRSDYSRERTLWGMYWYNPRGDPHQSPQRVFHTNGGSNRQDYSNAEVDRLIDEAAQIYDVAQAKPLYDRLNIILAEEDPAMIFTSNPNAYVLLLARVKNFHWVPDYFPRLRDLWIEQ